MEAIKIARRFAEMNEKEKAKASYTLALAQEEITPEEELEAASFIFFSEGDHRLPFTHFVSLFNQGHFQSEILGLMTQAFYLPNVKQQQKHYRASLGHRTSLSMRTTCFRAFSKVGKLVFTRGEVFIMN